MSRLFSATVTISVGIDCITFERRSGIFGRVTTAAESYPIGSGPSERARATLDVIETALAEARWQRARARVILSNALVRYTIVPSAAQVSGIADERSLAALKLKQVHGSAGPDLEVRLSSPLSGRHQLAAGLDGGFLDGLRGVLARARLRVVSIEPLLMRAFNASRSRFAERDFLFATIEPGLLGLGCVRSGAWTSLGFAPFEGSPFAALSRRLREAALAAEDPLGVPNQLYVHAEGFTFSLDGEIAGVRCQMLSAGPGA